MRMSGAPTDARYEASQDLAGLDLAEILRRAWLALRRNFWLVLLSGLAFAALAAFYAQGQAPYYDARSSLLIDPRVNEGMEAPQAPTILLADALVVDTEVLVLQSERILNRVIDRLGLMEKRRADLAAEGEPIPSDSVLRADLIGSIGQALDIEREAPTYVVRITARAKNPVAAADLANAVASEYFADQTANQLALTDQVSDWLRSQTRAMSQEVIAADSRVQQYLYRNDIPDEDVASATQAELDSTTQALIDARNRTRTAASEVEIIDRTLAQTASEVGPSRVVMLGQLVEALGGEPNLIASRLPRELQRLREVREASIRIADIQIAALQKREVELKAALAEINDKQIELRELRREANAMQIQYETLLGRLQQTRGQDRFFRSNARVIEVAAPPDEPANPDLLTLVVAAGFGGLIVGLGLVFVREQLDDTFRKSDDVFEQLGISYFGPLPYLGRRVLVPTSLQLPPHLDRRERREIARFSYAAYAPFSLLAETLHRTMVALRSRQPRGPKTIAAVSALAGEGKSFFASNFAFFLARQGHQVLLVDGDIRNPNLSRVLEPVLAMAPMVEGEAAFDTMELKQLAERLQVLHRRDTSRLEDAELQRRELPRLMAMAGKGRDFVIVDTAPMAFVSDDVSNLVDHAVLVIDWGRVTGSAMRRILKLNPALAEKIVGACLSKTRLARMQKYESIPVTDSYYNPGVVMPNAPGDRPLGPRA